jgi:tetratricopeptide (TPR) repeat protein
MLMRMLAALATLMVAGATAEARRVALVIGQNAYSDSSSATARLPSLDNPVRDGRRMAELLFKHGFEVIACDGTAPGCFDLDGTRFQNALAQLEQRAAGADLALVFFGGHGTATDEGNILTPTDAMIDCATGAVTRGVPVERIMAATRPARHKLVILDACRNNPLDDVCPNLKGKKLTFTRIEVGALRSFLLVTSTQFGQEALDGPPGHHSPFAASLFAALEASPNVYFDQVLNEVARATYEAAQKNRGFLQIPGRVVGGEAPADCLAGKGCVADARMAALAVENERLAADASGVRAILAQEEQARGKAYTAEERSKRVAELQETLARIATSTDPLRLEARRLIDAGYVKSGQAKLDQALDADEKAIAEAERVATERRKAAAHSARDLGVLARGTDVLKAVAYFQRATRLDPADAQTWIGYAYVARDAGRTGEAKIAFEQAVARAGEANDEWRRFWGMLGLGDVASARGSLPDALRHYQAATAIAEPIIRADPENTEWQRDLSVSHIRIGDVLRGQGNLDGALERYRASLAIDQRLAQADPRNAIWQNDLAISQARIGDVLLAQGNLPSALAGFQAFLAIVERLAKADPGDALWQANHSAAHHSIGEVLARQRNFPAALAAYQASLSIREHLAKVDPGNAGWQNALTHSQDRVGDQFFELRNFPAALAAYQASLTIRERLVKADPGNAGWESNLSGSHHRIGEVFFEQGNFPAALAAYQASLTIRERLAKTDPGNTGWQRELAWTHWRVGEALARQGARGEAARAFEQGRAIILHLRQLSPDDAVVREDLAKFEAELEKLRN